MNSQPPPAPDDRRRLTDHLAAIRSILANERTFLAYQRTAITTLAAAVTFIRFFDHTLVVALGWALIPCSGLTALLGAVRYRRMRRLLISLDAENMPPPL
jgi:putative membrane protein